MCGRLLQLIAVSGPAPARWCPVPHLLEHQWTVAVDYWGGVAAEAQRRGVKIAIEMHANQLVYNVPGLLSLRAAVGDAVRVNFDPSHLLWMGASASANRSPSPSRRCAAPSGRGR